ncbi:hypothetical protein ACDW_42960 (plasmid) [Acidovorax sp. DW039]|uniref:efflux RND transporter permease subunit n=1 Tax=Acidovorax sp. DW039 TaxID=3095606 RepID=UPI0030916EEB|nr:hypothetical protein ACDW_42960 [Acidovorax sp. DW039]
MTVELSARAIPAARIAVGRGANSETLAITLACDDVTALAIAASQAEAQLRTFKGIGNVTSSAALQRPEIQIHPDAARAAALGVTTDSLADIVRLATYGDYSNALPKLNLSERQTPVRVRMDPSVRENLNAVSQLRVQGSNGTVNLGSVADISIGSATGAVNKLLLSVSARGKLIIRGE